MFIRLLNRTFLNVSQKVRKDTKFVTTMSRPCQSEEGSSKDDDAYLGKVVEIEIMDGAPDPVIKEPSEYPDWLWKYGDDLPSLQDLSRKLKAGQNLTYEEHCRILKLTNRGKIKTSNDSSDVL